MRTSGILLPISSLPSPYGIGGFSKESYEFVDFLKEAGMTYWQILPLGPTGYGDSPYQSFSTFAGNPYFIDLEELIQKGWLTKEECKKKSIFTTPAYVEYDKVYETRFDLLRTAFENSKIEKDADFQEFVKENASWLEDYALYTAIKNALGGVSYIEWEEPLRKREAKALQECRKKYHDDIVFVEFQQYFFRKQWYELKAYANEAGIQIIGDIPIYVAFDSADTWAHPELFQFDEKGYPVGVAGCPPDAFSETGQLWGNPLYDWPYHKKTGFKWWIERIGACFELYDVVRIDHFRGFDEYYAIPYGDPTAEFGKWEQGPGYEFFKTIKETLGEKQIIAEDLGFLTDTVIELVQKTGYPGMKVLQFAFDPREESDYLPHNYLRNSVVYTGTHDNETTAGWIQGQDEMVQEFAGEYIGQSCDNLEAFTWAFIRCALASVSDTAIIPMQDYLGLDNAARINTPSTIGDNWKWRLVKGQLTDKLAKKIYHLNEIYARIPKKEEDLAEESDDVEESTK